jgi:hypothetical protein
VAVYTAQPELLRPVLTANPQVEAIYRSPAEYDPKIDAQIVILDGFRPPEMPKTGVICIQPPANSSPVKVRTTITTVPVIRWRTDHALGNGLRTKECGWRRPTCILPRRAIFRWPKWMQAP